MFDMSVPGSLTPARAAYQGLELLAGLGLVDRFEMDRVTGRVRVWGPGGVAVLCPECACSLVGEAIAEMVAGMVEEPKGEDFMVESSVVPPGGVVPFVENPHVRAEVYRGYWSDPFDYSVSSCRCLQ